MNLGRVFNNPKPVQVSLLLFAGVGIVTVASFQMGNRDHVLRCSDEDLAKDLSGKVYIVTGANSGVGLETTR